MPSISYSVVVSLSLELIENVSVTAGESLDSRNPGGIPRGYWNFSWVAEDDLSFPNDTMAKSGELVVVSFPQRG